MVCQKCYNEMLLEDLLSLRAGLPAKPLSTWDSLNNPFPPSLCRLFSAHEPWPNLPAWHSDPRSNPTPPAGPSLALAGPGSPGGRFTSRHEQPALTPSAPCPKETAPTSSRKSNVRTRLLPCGTVTETFRYHPHLVSRGRLPQPHPTFLTPPPGQALLKGEECRVSILQVSVSTFPRLDLCCADFMRTP